MAYIGKKPEDTFKGLAYQDTWTGDGSTLTFDMTNNAPIGGDNDIAVFVENVRQQPGSGNAYTLGVDGSGNNKRITFSTAPESGAVIYAINPGKPYETLTVADGSVTATKLATTLDLSSNTLTLPSTFVTTTGSQALSNKTINASSNTISNITNSNLSGTAAITNANLQYSSLTVNGTSISLGGSGTIVAGTSWQTVKTSGFTAVTSYGYFCDTTSAAFTATLPASPTLGNEISFIDYAGTFNTNNLTIGRNGNKIQGASEDLIVSTQRAAFTLVYVDSTQGWLLKDK